MPADSRQAARRSLACGQGDTESFGGLTDYVQFSVRRATDYHGPVRILKPRGQHAHQERLSHALHPQEQRHSLAFVYLMLKSRQRFGAFRRFQKELRVRSVLKGWTSKSKEVGVHVFGYLKGQYTIQAETNRACRAAHSN